MSSKRRGAIVLLSIICSFLMIPSLYSEEVSYLDLSEFGSRYVSENADSETMIEINAWNEISASAKCLGYIWNEERDIREIQIQFANQKEPVKVKVQYWFRIWPVPPPSMPTIEDKLDDIYQGKWLTAETSETHQDGIVTYSFKPLQKSENPNADNLPGVTYRRTMKIRLVFESAISPIQSLKIFSESKLKPLAFRVEFGIHETNSVWNGHLEIFNGSITSVKPWNFESGDIFKEPNEWKSVKTGKPKGIIGEIQFCKPSPAGSNDITVVTVRAESSLDGKTSPRTFSFNTLDLQKGPIYIPDLHAYITMAADPDTFKDDQFEKNKKIREQIPSEPEQTYERASIEIPSLDPWNRQNGDQVYLPVAADASWQKFAVRYDGNFFISKGETKAYGNELKRLQWKGDRIDFRIGTGEPAYYREDHRSKISIAEGFLPIVLNEWEKGGLQYNEESFATLLQGPLDPNDPGRSEQTPSILMNTIKITNPSNSAQKTKIWFSIAPSEQLSIENNRIFAIANDDGAYNTARFRAMIQTQAGSAPLILQNQNTVVAELSIPAGKTESFKLFIPFVSDLKKAEIDQLESLDFDNELKKTARYWRALVQKTTQFTVPEDKFNKLARSVVPHIHISTTKDPKSGLYMVPAASYGYKVYANESCFQSILLDSLGDTERSGQYLKTLCTLQGTRSFPGNYAEPHDGVLHGAKVDDVYDYTASSYGLDHGTVLWTLALHYSYTRDPQWLNEVLPAIQKAVEWIERQRALTKKLDRNSQKVLEYGLLPAGHLEDNDDWGYWFSVNAYCVAGMLESAKAMQDIHHPDADKMEAQAKAYLEDLRQAVLRMTEITPVTKMRDGTYSPYVPTKLNQRFRYFGPLRVEYYSRYGRPDVLPCYRLSATREVLYGPMILLNLGIFDVNEPIANWILDDWEDNLTLSSSGGFNVHGFTDDKLWFSQGGMVFQSNLQNPILVYLKRNETPAAIRGIYNNFLACIYPDVNAMTEEYRMWKRASGPFYKSPDEAKFVNRLRDTLVLESGDDLWLASGAPRRWFISDPGIQVDQINSLFGPVGFSMHKGKSENTIEAHVEPVKRNQPKNLWLYVRVPENKKIVSVRIDGKEWKDIDQAAERIRLPQTGKPVDLVISYQ